MDSFFSPLYCARGLPPPNDSFSPKIPHVEVKAPAGCDRGDYLRLRIVGAARRLFWGNLCLYPQDTVSNYHQTNLRLFRAQIKKRLYCGSNAVPAAENQWRFSARKDRARQATICLTF